MRDTIRAMRSIFRHKWSLASGAITAVHCLIIYGVIDYLYRRGMWHPDSSPASKSVVAMAWVHGLGMLLADVAAVVGIIVEKPAIYAVIALVLGSPTTNDLPFPGATASPEKELVMEDEQLKLPPARSLFNEIALLYDNISDLIEAQKETNRKLDALLANRQNPIVP